MIDNKAELLEKAYTIGFEAEKNWRGCAQCTLIGALETLGIKNPGLVKAGSGFAAGGGRMCDGICGGYAGGTMIMSSIFGRRQEFIDGDLEEKAASAEMAQKLRQVFLDEYGSVICGDIHQKIFGRNYDMNDETDKEQFDIDGAHTTKCTGVVGTATRETVRIILEEADKRGMSLEDVRKKAVE